MFFVELMQCLKVFFCISDNEKKEGKELTGGGGLSDKVSLYKGDITVLEVDAIVNAGKDLLFELLDGVFCLKVAQFIHCPWLPSTVEIPKVLVLWTCSRDGYNSGKQ